MASPQPGRRYFGLRQKLRTSACSDAYTTIEKWKATMLDNKLGPRRNDTTGSDAFAKHSFPPDGLVAQSRIAYESTPLLTAQIRSGVFVFAGAGANLTAIAGSPGGTIVDTGYRSRIAEIEDAIAGVLGRMPQWVINTHWHFDHTDGNAAFAAAGATILAHANSRARLSTSHYVPSLSWRISASPRKAWPSLTFDHPFTLDIGTEELHLLPQAPAHTDGDVAVLRRIAARDDRGRRKAAADDRWRHGGGARPWRGHQSHGTCDVSRDDA